MKKRIILVLALLVSAVTLTALPLVRAAGSASFSLNPGSGSATVGSNLVLTIRENSGSVDVDTVQSNLAYDAASLQYVTMATGGSAGSPFTSVVEQSGGAGSVRIAATNPGATVTGNQVVATVTFKALKAGNTNVSFAADSYIVQNGSDVWNHSSSAGTYTLSVAATPPPPPTPSPSPTPTPSSQSPSPSPSTTPAAPKSTANPASPTKASNSPSPSPTSLPTVWAADDLSPVGTFQTAANTYVVIYKVMNSKQRAVKGASVTLNKQTLQTNDEGIVQFLNVPAGPTKVDIKAKGFQPAQKTVSISQSELRYAAELTPSPLVPKTAGFFGAAAALVLIAAFVVLNLRRRRTQPAFAGSPAAGIVVGGERPVEPTYTPTAPVTHTQQDPVVISPAGVPTPPEPTVATSQTPGSPQINSPNQASGSVNAPDNTKNP